MKFDKRINRTDILTVITSEEAVIGTYGYFCQEPREFENLKYWHYGKLTYVYKTGDTHPNVFVKDNTWKYPYFIQADKVKDDVDIKEE